MKRVGYIFENICELDNIKLAIMNASIGKRNQKRVKEIIENINNYAGEIQQLLLNKQYSPSPYVIKTIKDGVNKKERTIHKPCFLPWPDYPLGLDATDSTPDYEGHV